MAIKPTNQLGNSLIENRTKIDLLPNQAFRKSKQKPQGKTVYFEMVVLEKISKIQHLLDMNNFSSVINLSTLIFLDMVNDEARLVKINTELSKGFTIEQAIKNVIFEK